MARLPEAAAGPEAAGYVDVFPVTVRLYQAFVEASGRHPPDGWDQQLEAPENPVVFVDVADAEAYAQWAGGRLPTELEWQAAARGDDPARPFPWDQGALDPANFSGSADKGLSSVDAHPGGVSPLGVMDLAGNAAEWTATPYPQDLLTDPERVGPRLPPAQHGRVVKGGDHLAGWLDLRVSRRQAVPEDERRGALGFRLVVDL